MLCVPDLLGQENQSNFKAWKLKEAVTKFIFQDENGGQKQYLDPRVVPSFVENLLLVTLCREVDNEKLSENKSQKRSRYLF